eukprot:10907715-Prorocentrum_lima.AAC.1
MAWLLCVISASVSAKRVVPFRRPGSLHGREVRDACCISACKVSRSVVLFAFCDALQYASD